jgi:hypothetical protein
MTGPTPIGARRRRCRAHGGNERVCEAPPLAGRAA